MDAIRPLPGVWREKVAVCEGSGDDGKGGLLGGGGEVWKGMKTAQRETAGSKVHGAEK